MMKATLTRITESSQGTFGIIEFGNSKLFTLELPDRGNARMVARILSGTYECKWVFSPRFRRNTYLLYNVPGRDAIRIHSANFAGDVNEGWVSQLNGCIAPALKIGQLKNQYGNMQQAGLLSAPAVRQLESWGNKMPFILEVK